MAKRLKAAVYVRHEGATHCFTPDDDVPAWAVKLINPARFTEPDEEKPKPAAHRPAKAAK